MEIDKEYKIVFLGCQNVGKTSLIEKKTYNTFRNKYSPTFGVSYSYLTEPFNTINCNIHIWDTSGQSKFKELTSLYYYDANCIIIMFDLSRKNTFLETVNIFNDVKKFISNKQTLFLIGNKLDKKNKTITVKDVNKYFNDRIEYIEISVKENIHLNIFEKILKQKIQKFIEETTTNTTFTHNIIAKKKKCIII